TTLFTEYEHGDGKELDTDMVRLGVRTRPWERTQVRSSINSQATENGERTFSNFGLTQGFTYKDNWPFDVGVDQTNTLPGAQLDPRLQIGVQYGIRYVSSTFEGERYAGVSDIIGFDLRRQLTRRFDLGAHVAVLHSWESDVMDHSTGIDVGMTIMKNMWVSLG